MSKQDLIEELKRRIETRRQCYGASYCEAVEDCLALVRQLYEPSAMEWRLAPEGFPRDAHVEGIGVARLYFDDDGQAVFSTAVEDGCCNDCVPLGRRRWCPIPPPPPLPERQAKGGDS